MNREGRIASKGQYYYASQRVNGQVVKEYVGRAADPIVQVLAQVDELSRAEANGAVAEVRAEQTLHKDLEHVLDALASQIRKVQEMNFLVSGYRRRKGALQAVKYRDKQPSQINHEDDGETLTRELFEHLAQRANRGDRAAADRLRQILQDHPEIWQEVGDLSQHAKVSLINLIADGNMVLRESVSLQVDELNRSLRQEATDETLEALLIEHIVVCWLELYYVRTAATQPQEHKKDTRFWEQRLKQANDRFHAALKELATLRDLLGRPVGVIPLPGEVNESNANVGIPADDE